MFLVFLGGFALGAWSGGVFIYKMLVAEYIEAGYAEYKCDKFGNVTLHWKPYNEQNPVPGP